MTAGNVADSVAIWRNVAFSRLWAGQSASLIGTQISRIALPLVAIETLRAGSFEVTAISVLLTVPFLLFGLPAGLWVDRADRRKIMIASDIGRACAMLSVPLCVALGTGAGLAWLYVVTAVTGTLTVFFDVAYGSVVPALVPRTQLEAANSRLTLSDTVSRLIGPGLAGVLVQAVGAAMAVVADGVSYIASVAMLVSIRELGPREARPLPKARRQLRDGLAHVLGHRFLRALLLTGSVLNLCDAGISALLLLLLTRIVGLSALQIGAAFALGAVGGMLASARPRLPGLSTVPALIAGLTMICCGRLVQAFLPVHNRPAAFALLVAAQMLTGFGAVSFNVVQVSARQRLTPDALLGRMTATMRMVIWGTLPAGAALAGVLAMWWGIRDAAITAACGTVLAPLLLSILAGGQVRDRREEPARG